MLIFWLIRRDLARRRDTVFHHADPRCSLRVAGLQWELPGEKAVIVVRFWRRRRVVSAARLSAEAWVVMRFALS
jgi:hypothetical protein